MILSFLFASRRSRSIRKGAIAVLALLMMLVLFAFLALSIDVGYMCLVRSEAQNAADAAALAGGQELLNEKRLQSRFASSDGIVSGNSPISDIYENVRLVSNEYAVKNRVGSQSIQLISDDIVIGRLENPAGSAATIVSTDPATDNAVKVTIRATADRGYRVPLFFGSIWGKDRFDVEATATAAALDRIAGFRATKAHPYTSLLPFTLQIDAWESYLAGGTDDHWRYDEQAGRVISGSDGIPETLIYPIASGPGNWGTLDIGGADNSTAVLCRQILDGVNREDLQYYGGTFKLDSAGQSLLLQGDTGISAGTKGALESIVGQPRTIPLYRRVEGNGNNLVYEIVGFAGIRIMQATLVGEGKQIVIQAAYVVDSTAVYDAQAEESYFISQPVRLVE